MCDSDVIGSGATSNNNTVDVNVDIPVGEAIPCCSSLFTQDINTPGTALSGLFSMIEYAYKNNKITQLECATSITIGCFKHLQLDLQLVPQLDPNSISQFPNLARVGVQVGVACLNAFYFHTISTSTHTSTSPVVTYHVAIHKVCQQQKTSTDSTSTTGACFQAPGTFLFFSFFFFHSTN